jgi:hypothetical protein
VNDLKFTTGVQEGSAFKFKSLGQVSTLSLDCGPFQRMGHLVPSCDLHRIAKSQRGGTYASVQCFFIVIFFEKGSHYVVQAGLKFSFILPHSPKYLGLWACTTTPSFIHCFSVKIKCTYMHSPHLAQKASRDTALHPGFINFGARE